MKNEVRIFEGVGVPERTDGVRRVVPVPVGAPPDTARPATTGSPASRSSMAPPHRAYRPEGLAALAEAVKALGVSG